MNGPTFQLQFTKGESYKIPKGYGFSSEQGIFGGSYLYENGVYEGDLDQIEVRDSYNHPDKKYLVFRGEKGGFYICQPESSFNGNVLSVSLKVLARGATIKDCIEEMLKPKRLIFKLNDEEVIL